MRCPNTIAAHHGDSLGDWNSGENLEAAQNSMEPKGRIWLHGPRGGKKAAGEKFKRERWSGEVGEGTSDQVVKANLELYERNGQSIPWELWPTPMGRR